MAPKEIIRINADLASSTRASTQHLRNLVRNTTMQTIPSNFYKAPTASKCSKAASSSSLRLKFWGRKTALALAMMSILSAPFMLTACGDDETSNVATQENTQKEEVKLGPACTHNVPTDETFEFKVLNIEGNPIPDALVCITPDKNSANCSGSMVSVRTNIDGVARIRMSHNIVDDYRITVQSPLYGGFDVFSPKELIASSNKIEAAKTEATWGSPNADSYKLDPLEVFDSPSSTKTHQILVEPLHDLVRLYMKHARCSRAQAIEAIADAAETSPQYFEGLLRLNSNIAITYSRVIGALNLPQRRLNLNILNSYIKGSIPTVTALIMEGVPAHQIVLAVKRNNSKANFPSKETIKAEANKNKNLRPPASHLGNYVSLFENSTHNRAIKTNGTEIALTSRIRIDNKNSSLRSKREGACDPRNIDINDNYIWLFPDGQKAIGRKTSMNYGSGETGHVDIDNFVCTKDAFGSLCAEDTLSTNIYDDKIISDEMLANYASSFRISHRLLKTLEDGSSVVEFTVYADPALGYTLDKMFNVELNPGDSSGRTIPVYLKNSQAKVVYTYAPGPRSQRVILSVMSFVKNSVNGQYFTKNDTDFVILKEHSAIPQGTKLVAIQAGGCGRDRSTYYFKLENPYKPKFAEELRNPRLTWELGNITKTGNSATMAVPADTMRLDFKKATANWQLYKVKLIAGREVFNFALSEVRDRKAGLCGPLDTLKLQLSDVTETGFTAKINYDYFDAWDAQTKTVWRINGQEVKTNGLTDRVITLDNLKCGTTVNVVAEGRLGTQSRRYETAINLLECGSGNDAQTLKWLNSLKLMAIRGEQGEVIFALKTNELNTPPAEHLENITMEANYGDGFSEIMPFSQRFSHVYFLPNTKSVFLRLYYGTHEKELYVSTPSLTEEQADKN